MGLLLVHKHINYGITASTKESNGKRVENLFHNGEFYKALCGQTIGELLQCLLVKRTWTATLHPCRYRQTPEYTHGRQPTYMSCSVPRVFFVFDLANFYKE